MKIGYACTPLSIPYKTTRKLILKNYTEEKLHESIALNIDDLFKIVKFNNDNNIKMFRISSDIIPFGSHEINTFPWETIFKSDFKKIGEYVTKNDIRLSMHPGQYTVLNSPDKNIVNRAIKDLEYHCKFLDSLNIDSSHKIILHIGGVYGNKKEAIERFITNYSSLSLNIKNRLIIENDEKNYSIVDVLNISNKTSAPVVFDNLHNQCNLDNPYSLNDILTYTLKTWANTNGRMKVHYSQQDKFKKIGSHSPTIFIDNFIEYYNIAKNYPIDIMLEVKDKDFSAFKINNIIKEKENSLTFEDKSKEFKRYELFLLSKGIDKLNFAKDILFSCSLLDFYKFIDSIYYENVETINLKMALESAFINIENFLNQKEINYIHKLHKKLDYLKEKDYLLKLSLKYSNYYLLNSYFLYTNFI